MTQKNIESSTVTNLKHRRNIERSELRRTMDKWNKEAMTVNSIILCRSSYQEIERKIASYHALLAKPQRDYNEIVRLDHEIDKLIEVYSKIGTYESGKED
jgi:hypothetical protein